MRDTRKQRQMLVTLIGTGVGAIVGGYYVAPWLAKQLNVRQK